MTRRRSYDATNENRDVDSELGRLAAQATLGWAVESARLLRLGVRDGMSILELGCGPGCSTALLRALLPSSPITAVDSDPEMLTRAERGLRPTADGFGPSEQVEFVLASATETGLLADRFDVAISRYLYQHLADPPAAAAEALRVLKPGGRHIIVDVDDGLWGVADPVFPELRQIYARAAAAQARRGGNRMVGRRLGRILRDAGFANVVLDVFSYDSDALGLEPFGPQLSPDRLFPLVEEHVLDLDELALAYRLHDRFVDDREAFVLMIGFMAYGEKR